MAGKNITIAGATFNAVPSIDVPVSGGGTASFVEISDTTAQAADVASGKYFYDASGVKTEGTASGGGGSGLTLLATKSLGTISTTATSATDTGQTVTVTEYGPYDLLIVEVSADTQINGRHAATISPVYLYNMYDISTKQSATILTRMNAKWSSSGMLSSATSSSGYGIYVYNAAISNGTVTLTMYMRYSSTYTGTINNAYTARVYGVKLFEQIRG